MYKLEKGGEGGWLAVVDGSSKWRRLEGEVVRKEEGKREGREGVFMGETQMGLW